MRQGRPLRFLALTLGGWATVRVVMLWPEVALPDAAQASVVAPGRPAAQQAVERRSATVLSGDRSAVASLQPSTAVSGESETPPAMVSRGLAAKVPVMAPIGTIPVLALAVVSSDPAGVVATQDERTDAVVPAQPATVGGAPRLAGSTWFVARPNGGENLAFGQLGASQAGVRLTYALGEDRRVALSGRLSAPVRGRGREGALGLDWRPTALPVHLLVEGRVPLDGGRVRPAAQLIAGVARPLPLGAQVEAYAQAGAVHGRGGFADGSARVVRPVLDLDTARVDVGAGVWGAAQRGVVRVDLGPTMGVAVPLGGATVRLGVDYRLRVAGRARPGSGPALTIGSSF